MKLRSTHHIRRAAYSSFFAKSLLVMSVVVMAFIAPLQPVQKVSADQYDDKINALLQDNAKYQAQSASLNAQAVTLQSALAQLANEQAALQTQITISQTQYDQLVVRIADTEKKIKDSQDALGTTIANLYVDQKISPLEMLASSKNISDYLDKQEYRNSVRDQLTSTIKQIKDLKTQLDKQKTDVANVLTQQQSARASLVAKTSEQQNLLSRTQGQEAGYQQLISANQSQIAQARAIQATINSRGTSTGGYKVITGGLLLSYVTDSRYGTWTDSNCPIVYTYMSSLGSDGNGGDNRGYGCRQCASYVAWKINQVKGYWPSWGDARNFTAHGSPTSPHAGAVAVLDAGASGHVAWVETDPYVNSKGQTVIQVSQYNFNYGQGYGMYSVMELSVNFFDHYVDV